MAPIISLFERADYGPSFTHVQHSKSGLMAAAIGSGLLALVIVYAYGGRILLAFLCFFFPCWFKDPPPGNLVYRRELLTHTPLTSPAMYWNDRIDPPPAYASTSSLPSFSERDPSLPPPSATEGFNTTGIEAPCSVPLPTTPPPERDASSARSSPEVTSAPFPAPRAPIPPMARPQLAHIRGAVSQNSP